MKQPETKRKLSRLFWDLEVSPNVLFSWRIGRKVSLIPDNIITERAIICVCYKWEHEKEIHSLTWDKNQSDKTLVKKLVKIVQSADEIVAQNGDRFDVPWLRTRFLYHGGIALPRLKTADTFQWSKRNFYFNSNKLDYIADFLGIGRKLHTDYNLWKSIILHKDAKALARMVEYCKQDVVLLEKVWKRLSMTVQPKTHAAVLSGDGDSWACPRCESKNVRVAQTRVTASGTVQKQMVCSKCGGFHTINLKAYERCLEYKRKEKEKARK